MPQIAEAQRAALQPLSLDVSQGGEDAADLGEQLADDDAEVVADAAGKRAVAEGINQLLGDLSEREEDIVSMRFGLGDYAQTGARSAEEVAEALKISVARVHDLELRALRNSAPKPRAPDSTNCSTTATTSNVFKFHAETQRGHQDQNSIEQLLFRVLVLVSSLRLRVKFEVSDPSSPQIIDGAPVSSQIAMRLYTA